MQTTAPSKPPTNRPTKTNGITTPLSGAYEYDRANRIAADLKAARDNYPATRFPPLTKAGQPSAGDGDRMNAAIDRTRQSLFPDSPLQGKEVYVQKTIGAGGSMDLIFDAGLEACIVNANRQPDVHGGFLLLSYSKYRKKDIWVKTDQTAYNDTLKPGGVEG